MSDDKKRDEYDIELGEKNGKVFDAPTPPPQPRFTPAPSTSLSNNPILPILSYCASSILMTVTNKYVLSGTDYNLNFFLLCVQVCAESTIGYEDADKVFRSPLSALSQFRHASHQGLSTIVISRWMKQRSVCAGSWKCPLWTS
jgi:hypothetical protein